MEIIMTILIITTAVELMLIYVMYRDLDTNSMESKYKLDLMYVYMCLAILNINFMCNELLGHNVNISYMLSDIVIVMILIYLVMFYVVPARWYVKLYRSSNNVLCYQTMMYALHRESTLLCTDINGIVLYINETCKFKHRLVVKGLLFNLSSVDHVVTDLDLNLPNRENLINHDLKAIYSMLELIHGCSFKSQLKHSEFSKNKHIAVNGALVMLDKALNDFIEYNDL